MLLLCKAGTDDLKDLNLPVDKSVRTDIVVKDHGSLRLVLRIAIFCLCKIILIAMTVAVVAWSRSKDESIPTSPALSENENVQGSVSISAMEQHNTANDCWIALYGNVYNLSAYNHPGSQDLISRQCGLDTTTEYSSNHPQVLVRTIEHLYLGIYGDNAADVSSEEATVESLVDDLSAIIDNIYTAGERIDDSSEADSLDSKSKDSDD